MSETLVTEAANPTQGQDGTQAAAQTATNATQQATDQSQQAEGTKAAESTAQVAPEKYEFKFSDDAAKPSDAVIGEFSAVAKELNMSQENAQKVLDKMMPALASQQADLISKASEDWAQATRTDKEIGGAALQENLGFAKKALESFGSPELRSLLETTSLGNNPEVIRFMVRAGKALSSDQRFPNGHAPAAATKSAAEVLYGKQ